jgi:hypothetical protein
MSRVRERLLGMVLGRVLDPLAVSPDHYALVVDVDLVDEAGRHKQLPSERHRGSWLDDKITAGPAFNRLNYLADRAVASSNPRSSIRASASSRNFHICVIPIAEPPFLERTLLGFPLGFGLNIASVCTVAICGETDLTGTGGRPRHIRAPESFAGVSEPRGLARRRAQAGAYAV